jgi:hypothetical protein
MVTSKGRLSFWQGFSLAGFLILVLALFAPSAYATHNQKTLISTGPAGGNGPNPATYDAVNQNGTLAFFETDEQLVSGDTDSNFDVYQRSVVDGTTTLISIGPDGGNGLNDVFFDGISADGSKVFFETDEKLINGVGDNDNAVDIFQRSGGTTTLISGPGNGGAPDAFFDGNSSDGSHVFFDTEQQLDATNDTDSSTDVYDGTGGGQTLISAGQINGNGAFFAQFAGNSADGSKVWFETSESLVAGDTDSKQDVYQRASGTTTEISSGIGAFDAFFDASSTDGSRVFYSTSEAVLGGDTDSSNDVYQVTGGTTSLISTGTTNGGAFSAFFEGSSQDGTKVFFRTAEKVETSDTDSSQDVWQRSGGTTTTQISTGTTSNGAGFPASFDGSSADGTIVFWSTAEQVEAGDTDSSTDVYQRSGGTTTTRLSTGLAGGNGAFPAFFEGSSTDGSRVFLSTAEKLETGDNDSQVDIYERSSGTTTLLSTGATGGNGAFTAFFDGSNASGKRVFIDTQESLQPADTDSQIDIYAGVTLPYDHPIGAGPMRLSLVPVFNSCPSSSVNSTHGGPLNFGSCNPPVPASSTARFGSGGAVGMVKVYVCNLAATDPHCTESGVVKPDLRLIANLRDIRCTGSVPAGCSTGADYNPNGAPGPYTTGCTGIADCNQNGVAAPYCAQSGTSSSDCIAGSDLTLTGRLPGAGAGKGLRITDIDNGPGQDTGATVVDSGFPIPMDCLPTPTNSSLGSVCGVNTSANALSPGAALAGAGATWELGEVQVLDSGPDGIRGNVDDQALAAQGIYLP